MCTVSFTKKNSDACGCWASPTAYRASTSPHTSTLSRIVGLHRSSDHLPHKRLFCWYCSAFKTTSYLTSLGCFFFGSGFLVPVSSHWFRAYIVLQAVSQLFSNSYPQPTKTPTNKRQYNASPPFETQQSAPSTAPRGRSRPAYSAFLLLARFVEQ